MNNNKYIQAIENSVRSSMQEELSNKIAEDEGYKKKIKDIQLDMYLRYFGPFARYSKD